MHQVEVIETHRGLGVQQMKRRAIQAGSVANQECPLPAVVTFDLLPAARVDTGVPKRASNLHDGGARETIKKDGDPLLAHNEFGLAGDSA
jgi:hypothetical protein